MELLLIIKKKSKPNSTWEKCYRKVPQEPVGPECLVVGVRKGYSIWTISHLSRHESGRKNPAEFKSFWRCRFSVELQICNASVMSRKAYDILGGQKHSSELETFHFFVH